MKVLQRVAAFRVVLPGALASAVAFSSASASVSAGPEPPDGPAVSARAALWSVADFGAVPDVPELQTAAIQAAIDACFRAGGGTVEVPPGVWRTGGLRLRSHVTLHLRENAVLKGSRNPEDYDRFLADEVEPVPPEYVPLPPSAPPEARRKNYATCPFTRWNNALVKAFQAEDIAVLGEKGSAIDGSDCFDAQGEEGYRGPHGINFRMCRGIALEGYEVRDSGNWAHALFDCRDIRARRISVRGGHDGFHIRGCDNVSLADSEFRTGDDGLAGFDNIGVRVEGCLFNSSCSGMRFGGTDVRISRCRFAGPGEAVFRGSLTPEEKRIGAHPESGGRRNMLSFFTYFCTEAETVRQTPGNIVVEDCEVENCDRFLHYNFSGSEAWQRGAPLASVVFRNVRASGIRLPLTMYGDAERPTDWTFEHVRISFADTFRDGHAAKLHAARGLRLRDVTFEGAALDTLFRLYGGGDARLDAEGLVSPVPRDAWVRPADEPFKVGGI